MKMVKSLLLGTAAGLVAIAGAQAADLPVKAKPVQYVKICSLYGAGFYYIPGTDTCLKMGGWIRQYIMWNANGSLTNGALVANTATRGTTDWGTRTRGYITADARNQTEYGTVRGYLAVGMSALGAGTTADVGAGSGPGFSANRGFIQFAGFTFGLSQSFFDLYSAPATSFWGGAVNPSEDSGDGGKVVSAYTAQFGNGFSASISAEGRRDISVFNGGNAAAAGGAGGTNVIVSTAGAITLPASSAEGAKWPDVVGNLRVDQTWGSAQVMAAIHDASGSYYGTTTNTGNPANAIGWAAGAGAKINTPSIGAGDYFQFEVNYAEGASGYVNNGAVTYLLFNGGGGGSMGFGIMSDSVYGGAIPATGSSIQLTTSWGVNAAFEHHWNPHWQTSVYGAYVATSYNAVANAILCSAEGAGVGIGTAAVANPGCNNNFAVWNVGTRTQWNIDAQTYIGIDVLYQNLKSATIAGTPALSFGQQPAAARTISDQSAWMAEFRVHRNFYP